VTPEAVRGQLAALVLDRGVWSAGPVCGIAGYSLSASSKVDRTLVAQTLLAAIAERGADAVGYGYRGPDVPLEVRKQRTGASELLDSVHVPERATEALVHVRDYTKGHPSLAANNHPVQHGDVVGIHNGIIVNDEELFARHGWRRDESEMTVDSEAIFALAEERPRDAQALEELYGAMATAWLDRRAPDEVFVARGVGRPLWLGESTEEIVFASTREALELAESYAGLELSKQEVPEGTFLTASGGRIVERQGFEPDRTFREEVDLPAIRAPEERISCLRRLAVLAAATG
jgi:glucosamine 6-phosphate synthetase-like amidotransferase/phosphosugar isomerase protein